MLQVPWLQPVHPVSHTMLAPRGARVLRQPQPMRGAVDRLTTSTPGLAGGPRMRRTTGLGSRVHASLVVLRQARGHADARGRTPAHAGTHEPLRRETQAQLSSAGVRAEFPDCDLEIRPWTATGEIIGLETRQQEGAFEHRLKTLRGALR